MPHRITAGLAWPPDLLGLGSLLIADGGEDTWGKLAAAAATLFTLAMVGAWYQVRAWWDASAVRELLKVRRELAECKADLDQAKAELKDERSNRMAARERDRAEHDELRATITTLRAQVTEKDRTIADRDAQIRYRDHTVEENARRIDKLSGDLAALAAVVLVFQGNARSRGS